MQEACLPVATELGFDPLLHHDEAFESDRKELVTNVVATHAQSAAEMANGQAAKQAAEALGCAACMLANVCAVKPALEALINPENTDEILTSKIAMGLKAPAWLRIARQNLSGTSDLLAKMASGNSNAIITAVESGEFDIDNYLCGTANTVGNVHHKSTLPELQNIRNLREESELFSHIVDTPAGTFEVIDASEAIGFKKAPLGVQERGVLFGKLLNRMSEVGANGKPLVTTSDAKMQKAIVGQGGITFNTPGANLFEMRMTGKNRMYFTVHTEQDGSMRIVVLGSHGGDESTQRQFLDVTVAGAGASR